MSQVAWHVSKPSVNKAMNVLKEKGYVLQESYGDIHLTDAGRDLAKSIYLRHETISGFYKMYLVSVLKMLMRMPVTLNMSSVRRPFKN